MSHFGPDLVEWCALMWPTHLRRRQVIWWEGPLTAEEKVKMPAIQASEAQVLTLEVHF